MTRPTARSWLALLSFSALVLGSAACDRKSGKKDAGSGLGRAGELIPRAGDEILVAGQLVASSTPVKLWLDPAGYDAYRPHRYFSPGDAPTGAKDPKDTARFGSFRRHISPELTEKVRARGWTFKDLQESVHQVVIHFDACGSSQRCFEVLHDVRGLSCHFLLDVDGTVYQTLDLKERAWHAAIANDRSIGIEIASVGARGKLEELSGWYVEDPEGLRLAWPDGPEKHRLAKDFVARPARGDELFRAKVNGREVVQYDFTEAQYRSLERLLLTLARVFPRVKAAVPRDAEGRVIQEVLPEATILEFEGLIGHHHVSTHKVDPGPAFDWERVIDFLKANGVK